MTLKFRAWDKENKRWMTPEIEDNEESEIRFDLWGNIDFRLPWHKQTEGTLATVCGNDMFYIMQSTGLKDKNGVEIFEGDILKHIDFSDNETTVNVVYMKYGSLVFDVKVDDFVYDVPVYRIHPEANRRHEDILEVIGNIWEDGDLIDSERTKTY